MTEENWDLPRTSKRYTKEWTGLVTNSNLLEVDILIS